MIVDTGVLYALVDQGDANHAAAKEVFSAREHRVIPEPVVAETDWLILERLGVDAEVAFLRGLGEETVFVECPTPEDRERAADLVEQYRDAEIGYIDAVVVAVAERVGETRIATLDPRDFGLIRPRHVGAFEIVP